MKKILMYLFISGVFINTSKASTFTIGLLNFSAQRSENTVTLNWETVSEMNNDYFEIERSLDGVEFESVNLEKAAGDGNSSSNQTYASFDNSPYSCLTYYRLKQVEKSGKITYSKIVYVNLCSKSIVSIYPNPARNILHVHTSGIYRNETARIIDPLGNEILSFVLSADYNTIDISNFKKGVYYLIVSSENASITSKPNITLFNIQY